MNTAKLYMEMRKYPYMITVGYIEEFGMNYYNKITNFIKPSVNKNMICKFKDCN